MKKRTSTIKLDSKRKKLNTISTKESLIKITIGNNQGNVSIIGILLISLVLLIGLNNIATSLEEYHAQKFQYSSYLCAKHTMESLEDYYKHISITNTAINTAYLGQFAVFKPSLAIASKNTFKTLKASQQIYHISFMKNLTSYEHCSLSSLADLIRQSPLETTMGIKIKRDSYGRARFRKKWKFYFLFIAPKNISQIKYSFAIQINMRAKFQNLKPTKYQAYSKELTTKAFHQLKQLGGALF